MNINLFFAFSAGAIATINPCGWAMLPSFISYYLGSDTDEFDRKPALDRAKEGIVMGLLLTAGFLLIFGVAAVIISAGLQVIVQFMPTAAFIVGVLLFLLGWWLLFGKSLPVHRLIPNVELDVRARNKKSVFLYGVGYGITSLSCTLPIFLIVVSAGLTVSGVVEGAIMFLAYATGIAAVLMGVAISAALFKGALAQKVRPMLPYMNRVGAVLLILAGAYLMWYQGRYLPFINQL